MSYHDEMSHSEYIQRALINLMGRMTYKSIRIHHVVKAAGISRNTFYRSYNNKDQVIYDIFDIAMSGFLEDLIDEEQDEDIAEEVISEVIYENVLQIFTGLDENRALANLLFSADIDELIYNRFSLFFNRLCGRLIRSGNSPVKKHKLIDFLLSHLTGSAFHFIKSWMLDPSPPPTEKMAQLYSRILLPNLELITELADSDE